MRMYQDKSSLFSDISSFFIFPVLQQIPRLAVEHLADGFEGGEADGLCLTCLQDGKVGGSDVNLLRQSIFSANSPSVIFRRAIIISKFTTIGIGKGIKWLGPVLPSASPHGGRSCRQTVTGNRTAGWSSHPTNSSSCRSRHHSCLQSNCVSASSE